MDFQGLVQVARRAGILAMPEPCQLTMGEKESESN